jgi:hypothetical protein
LVIKSETSKMWRKKGNFPNTMDGNVIYNKCKYGLAKYNINSPTQT